MTLPHRTGVGRFRRDRGGNITMVMAIGAIALFGAAGLAVDVARTWMMRSRVATSLDAAAIAAARSYISTMSPAELTQLRLDVCAVYWANFGIRSTTNPCATSNGSAEGFMGAVSFNPVLTVGANGLLTINVDVRLSTAIVRVLGLLGHNLDEVRTTASASAQRGITAMEIALALDVTGTMYFEESNGVSKVEAMRTAAASFVSAVFGGATTLPSTYVAVVPFAHHVNLGRAQTAMVTSASLAQYTPLRDLSAMVNGVLVSGYTPGVAPANGSAYQDGFPVPWRGCVLARGQVMLAPNGAQTVGDLTDTPPTSDATRYHAWFYPSSVDATAAANARFLRGSTNMAGDNNWRSYLRGNAEVNRFVINEWALNQRTARSGTVQTGTQQDPQYITGPSLGCLMESRYEVLPLNANRDTILARINNLEAHPWLYHRFGPNPQNGLSYSGTVIHQGVHTAWMTLSHRWNGLWVGAAPNTPLPTSEGSTKVIVLMTDGANDFGLNMSLHDADGDLRGGARGAPQNCDSDAVRTTGNSGRQPWGCPGSGTRNHTTDNTAYGPYGRLVRTGSNNAEAFAAPYYTTSTAGVPNTGNLVGNDRGDVDAESNRRLARVCENAKSNGVRIYTVAFRVPENANASTIRNLLTNCATSPGDYFRADDATALNAAFQDIATRLGRVRLVR